MIHTGDCIDVMRGMEAESVDAIVTDPPYGLEFMGKAWDKFGATVEHPDDGEGPWGRTARVRFGAGPSFQAWCTAWGTEALRVTKPGGYLLAFGGTRTQHRLVCGLEDAGWLIRDELVWIYASGFPKGKANLKPAHEPIVMARKPGPLRPLAIDDCRIPSTDGFEKAWDKPISTHAGNVVLGNLSGTTERKRVDISANKPVGGRWPSNVLLSDPELFDEPNPGVVGSGSIAASGLMRAGTLEGHESYGGFPGREMAADTYGDSGGYSRFFIVPKADRTDREPVLRTDREPVLRTDREPVLRTDRERIFGDGLSTETKSANPTPRHNVHPTVKPTDLMRHLVRLVTPPGGIVLDPFLGSGSTAIACELEGVDWVGIEKEPEYVAIAEARLNGVQKGLGLSVAAS